MEFTSNKPSPRIFRKWAAIAALGGALQRRCYTVTGDGRLYPNLFTLLISPPGVGKSKAIDVVRDLWVQSERFTVAPDRLTGAGLIDALMESKKAVVLSTVEIDITHSMLVASAEFGVLVPTHDTAFLNTLNDLFDCRPYFQDRTRMHGKLHIENPHIAILAGTQPKYLSDLLPEGAWHQGFMSRMIMVYDDLPVKIDLFNRSEVRSDLRHELLSYITHLSDLRGEFKFNAEAVEIIRDLHLRDIPPVPDHPKLQSYNARRIIHLIKLCMIHSIAESDDLVITAKHVREAEAVLHEAEERMPQIFTSMSVGTHMDAMNETFDFIYRRYMKNKNPIPESAITHFLAARVPTNQISYYIETMEKARMINCVTMAPNPRAYVPRSKLMEE